MGFLKERLICYNFFAQLKWSGRVYTLTAVSGLNTSFCSQSRGINGTHASASLFLLLFSKVRCRSKSALGCYIIETAASIASNDEPYER